ncbi:MAG: glycoside hydrolase [Gammaproteobacteria bacterium]|nr:glycoside hydrolase [Gammaproteobacteria bacterium]
MTRFNLIVFVLFLVSYAHSSMAAMDHNASKKSPATCADVSQPARLKCAVAPSGVFDRKGDLYVAWSFGGHVYISRSSDKGKSFFAPLIVNRVPEAISARGENRPKVAVDNKGRIYVSWTTPLEKRFTGNIRFSYSEDGKNFSDTVIVNDNLDLTGHRFDALGVNNNGDIYIAWLDKRHRYQAEKKQQKYKGAAVYYALSEDGGKTFKPNKKIADQSCECCRVIMDMDRDDLPVVFWRHIFDENVRDHAMVKFSGKNQPGEVVRVSHDQWHIDACPHHGPDMSINESGDYHLAWFNNAPERQGLFYARYNKLDKTFSQSINFGNYKATASHPNIEAIKNQVWLVWQEFDGKQHSIWLQKSLDGGDNWQKSEKMATASGNVDYPFFIKDGDQLYIQWQTSDTGFNLVKVTGH